MPKTRSGCLTCRIRRVKCDEARPACQKCTSTRRNMRGHHASAGFHIRSGAKLLRETVYDHQNGVFQHKALGKTNDLDSYAPLEVLAGIFAGLDPQVTMLYQRYFPGNGYHDAHFSFSRIEEAKSIFDYGYCLFASSLASQLPCDPEQFSAAIEARMAVLQLHLLNTYVSFHLEHLPPPYWSRWDIFIPQMQEMVLLGEKIVSSTRPENNLGGHTTSFCLDMGFIIPLYTVASQCRDQIVCRRAIALLRSTSRQEGLWNSLLVAKAAERIMEIEESGWEEIKPCTDDANRSGVLSAAKPILRLDERGMRLQYSRQGQGNNAQTTAVEELGSWAGI
ncbi:uncharacterized protein BCR38DRAFT_467959 [Pseudomassariella vexata]|uniref:Zn(2)-C6 fungal-type domain-containing protein n=1 Tax=Pseudomassariella vexata TaxID=1141098 RepID=A0A1Y2DL10_9PEZI|nr:uncharacterized protein BCR38DRAFT_467959 [Pseudomassariella vexata]ORY59960.1 hypothetical protein BCR38DRAFT_467959 [Pseudomassariella vexata]